MNAGKLRHQITFKIQPTEQGSHGQRIEDTNLWIDFVSARASVEPLSGRELYAAQQVNSEISHRVKMRYRTGIKPEMRIRFGQRFFDVIAPLDIEERHRELHVMCKELL